MHDGRGYARFARGRAPGSPRPVGPLEAQPSGRSLRDGSATARRRSALCDRGRRCHSSIVTWTTSGSDACRARRAPSPGGSPRASSERCPLPRRTSKWWQVVGDAPPSTAAGPAASRRRRRGVPPPPSARHQGARPRRGPRDAAPSRWRPWVPRSPGPTGATGRLRFAQLVHLPRPTAAVHLSTTAPLPFAAGEFEVVCVDVTDLPPPTTLRGLIDELRRVITPGGTVAVTVTRFSYGSGGGRLPGRFAPLASPAPSQPSCAQAAFPVVHRFAELRAGAAAASSSGWPRAARSCPGPRRRAVDAGASSIGWSQRWRGSVSEPCSVPGQMVLGSDPAGEREGLVQSLPELREEPLPPSPRCPTHGWS